jgi:hypothetical protein
MTWQAAMPRTGSPDALPTGRRGRMLALGITVAAMLALWLGLVRPLMDLYDRRADTLAQRLTLARHMERLAAERPALEARATELGTRAAGAPRLSGSIPVATAALQGLVQDIAGQNGASLSSVESLASGGNPTKAETQAAETGSEYRRVGVKLAVSASWPVLVRFLRALEQSPTPMTVDDLQVRSGSQGTQANQQSLEAGFSVYAPAGPGSTQDAAP